MNDIEIELTKSFDAISEMMEMFPPIKWDWTKEYEDVSRGHKAEHRIQECVINTKPQIFYCLDDAPKKRRRKFTVEIIE